MAWIVALVLVAWSIVEMRRDLRPPRDLPDVRSHMQFGTKPYSGSRISGVFDAKMSVRGRVIDQFGVPVVGADILVVVSRYGGIAEEDARANQVTDEEGRFEVPWVSASQILLRASHPLHQYVAVDPTIGAGSSDLVSQFDVEGEAANGNREVILHLHRLDPERRIAHLRTGRLLQGRGDPPIVVVSPCEDSPSVSEPDRVVVEFTISDPGDPAGPGLQQAGDRTYDWSHRVEVPGGGLVAVQSFAGYQAPVDGYVESVTVSFQSGQEDWRREVSRRYYARFPSGRYGAVQVLSHVYDGVGRTRVTVWVNEEAEDRGLSGGKVPLW